MKRGIDMGQKKGVTVVYFELADGLDFVPRELLTVRVYR
jgi:hypothetical protein